MKKTLLFIFSGLMLVIVGNGHLYAQNENSLLWEISGNGLEKPSYVFGTIHMICPDDFFMPEKVEKAVSSADMMYMELDMDDPEMMTKVQQTMVLGGDETLKALFTTEEYEKLSGFMKEKTGLDIAMIDKMKPLALTSMLAMQALDCKMPASYERSFKKMADSAQLEIKGLETVKEQMSVFDSIPDTEEADMIMEMVNDFAEQKAEFDKMVTAYKQQNIQALYKHVIESPNMEDWKNILLDKRNQNWIPKMSAAMKANSVFFAVGAGHLAGKQGVLKLLKKQGYTVKAMK